MKLTIENYEFVGKLVENNIRIELKRPDDIIFFSELSKKLFKENGRIDIKYKKILNTGIFKNCFPYVSFNEDFVDIVFDCYIIDSEYKE